MGCLVEKTDTGVEVEIHRFDTRDLAAHYLTVSRGYTFDRHEPWGVSSGIDFYRGRSPHFRASLREKTADGWKTDSDRKFWSVAFWVNLEGVVLPVYGKAIKEITFSPEHDRGANRAATLFLLDGEPTINIWFNTSGKIMSAHIADGSKERFLLNHSFGRAIRLDLHTWLASQRRKEG